MVYTVGEMAKKLDVPASTLRYYDKEGLLPFVERSSGGIRMFRESDFEWLQVIGCMKKAGMSIRDIRQYIELALRGDDTIDTRLKMFTHQRDVCSRRWRRCATRSRPWSTNAGIMKLQRPRARSMSQGIWRTRTCPNASAPSGANSRRFRRSKGKLLFCRQAGKG